MIWFIVPFVALMVGITYMSWREWQAYRESLGVTILSFCFLTFMTAMVSALVFMFGNFIAMNFVDREWRVTNESAINAISDNGATQGRFFLGSGSVDSKPVFWYYENHEGYSTLESVPANISRIVESAGEPRVVVQRKESTNPWLLIDVVNDERYTFYVPKNSITNNFELDARP